MACRPAPACQAVRDQATRLWPTRSQASDGICASPKHSATSPNSDHEPNAFGYATAVDLTDDKASGCDAEAWAEHLRTTRDPRVKYVISNRRIFSSSPTSTGPAWTWRPYSGSNPHDKHAHLSITIDATFDTSPWFPQGDDDDMTPEQNEWLGRVHHELVNPDSDFNKNMKVLAEIHAMLAKGAPAFGVLPVTTAVTEIHRKVVG